MNFDSLLSNSGCVITNAQLPQRGLVHNSCGPPP
jgi:hypothetical protein